MPFSQRILWPSQLAKVREVAFLAMTQQVSVYRREDAPAPAPSGDYGDDALTFTQTVETKRAQVKGWVTSTPTPMQQVDSGAIVTANTYMLYVPVGTDILPGDHVFIEGSLSEEADFTVSDTTHENTWAPMLACSLRHRE
jgi:hypothetical protein